MTAFSDLDGAASETGQSAEPASGVYNFAAGPGVMPTEVLATARQEFLDWHGTGLSVWEMPFTGDDFRYEIYHKTRAALSALLGLPADYELLFLQGGASTQFSSVPLNLLQGRKQVAYFDTGHWSAKAITEAQRYADIDVVWSGSDDNYCRLPSQRAWQLDPDTAYCHLTPNETVEGLAFHWIPEVGDVPLVADMTSCFLSEPLDVRPWGLVYAGAQKNIGPAGLTVVIVHQDLIAEPAPQTPSTLSLKTQVANDGLFNTPPTYSVYLAGLVFGWIERQGGLEAMQQASAKKSGKLYAAIDGSDFYNAPVAAADRSSMNVRFHLPSGDAEAQFLEAAEGEDLVNLRGHGAIGGIRASLYNAMPEAGVDALVTFMGDFERRHG
jgi:phosphoserine aminotransferase